MKRVFVYMAAVIVVLVMAVGLIAGDARAEDKVSVTGECRVSSLPAGCDVVVSGETNIIVDAEKTISSISGSGTLNITGGAGKTLTVKNQTKSTIQGDTLEITIDANLTLIPAESCSGISVDNGSVTINGGSITIKSSNYGIFAFHGDIIINNGLVNIYGQISTGLCASGYRVFINGGTVNICDEGGNGIGVHAYNEVRVLDGATLNIAGAKEGIQGRFWVTLEGSVNINTLGPGILSGNKLRLMGGRINVASEEQAVIAQLFDETGEIEMEQSLCFILPAGGSVSGDGLTINDASGTAAKELRLCEPVYGAEYALAGITAAAQGVEKKGSGGYGLTGTSLSTAWNRGSIPSADRYSGDFSGLFTDFACINALSEEPAPGVPYYVEVSVWDKASGGGIDYTQIRKSACRLEVEGYTASCVGVKPGTDRASVIFRISPKSEYTLTGIRLFCPGLESVFDIFISPGNILKQGNIAYTWEGGNDPGNSGYRISCGEVCADSNLKKSWSAEPAPGGSGYFRFNVESQLDDHRLDLTQLQKNACKLDMAGYTSECFRINTYVDAETGHDTVRIVFKITRLPVADYMPTGLTISASEIGQPTHDTWKPLREKASVTWKDEKAPQDAYFKFSSSFLYTDEEMSTAVSGAPAAGDTRYWRYTVTESDDLPEGQWIDFSWLGSSACTLEIPGYTSQCVIARRGTNYAGKRYILLVFRIEAADYTLNGLFTSSAGAFSDSDGRWRLYGCKADLTWKNEEAPEAYWGSWSPLYTDAACTEELKREPIPVYASYYVKYTVFKKHGEHSIDFSRLRASDCVLELDGWTTKCSRVTAVEDGGRDGVEVVFWLVRLDKEHLYFTSQPEAFQTVKRDESFRIYWELNMVPDSIMLQYMVDAEWYNCTSLTGRSEYYLSYDPDKTDDPSRSIYRLVAVKDGETTETHGFMVKWKDTYTLTGFSASATGVAPVNDGSYYLTGRDYTLSWLEETPGRTLDRFAEYTWSAMCSDAACTRALTEAPVKDGEYYVRFTGSKPTGSSYDLDFSWLNASDCVLELEGYSAECVSLDSGTDKDGSAYINAVFRLVKLNADPITYPVWVKGIQVDSDNMDNVFGDDYTVHQVVFTPATGSFPARLALNNVALNDGLRLPDFANTYAGI